MKRVIILLIATAFSVLAEPDGKNESPTQSSAIAEARKAIDKGNAQWIEAWDAANASLIAGLFAADGIMLGRTGKSFKGPKEIFERMKTLMEAAGQGVKATVTTVDLWLDGDTAYETGKYSYTSQEKGQPVTDEGRYVTIWKHQSDRSWKIVADMGVPKD
jgi:uncharacterized protein (TIGR02246 family)